MASKGWFNLESAGSVIPETQYFEGESAFKFLNLSRTTRLYGFCILGGIVLFLGQIILFAFLYGVGTLVSLAGTGFLLGFGTQLKLMFKPVRVLATVVFLASIAMVFVGAFVIGSELLCIILVIVEYLAFTWYSLSYIPYARTAVLKMIGFS